MQVSPPLVESNKALKKGQSVPTQARNHKKRTYQIFWIGTPKTWLWCKWIPKRIVFGNKKALQKMWPSAIKITYLMEIYAKVHPSFKQASDHLKNNNLNHKSIFYKPKNYLKSKLEEPPNQSLSNLSRLSFVSSRNSVYSSLTI